MYVPESFAMAPDEITAMLAGCDAGDLVTVTPEGLQATFAPFLYDPSVGEHGAVLLHLARNNPQWRGPTTGQAMLLVHGPDGYVSPGWYPSKTEHGRVVSAGVIADAAAEGQSAMPAAVAAAARR